MSRRDDDLIATLVSLAPDAVAKQRRKAVLELRERGWTLQDIADRVGVTKAAVSNWVNRTS